MSTHIPAHQYWPTQVQARLAGLHRDEIWASGSLKQRAELATHLLGEAEALHDIVGLMKTHANACRPISALPPEVFNHIVGFVADEQPSSWTLQEIWRAQSLFDPGWLSLRLVCKGWRNMCTATKVFQRTRSQNSMEDWPSITIKLPEHREFKTLRLPSSLASCLLVLQLHNLNGLSLSGVLNVLRQMPLLHSLDFRVCQWDRRHFPSAPTFVCLDRLRALALSNQVDEENRDALCNVLKCLRFSTAQTKLHLGLHLGTNTSTANIVALVDVICLAARCIEQPDTTLCVHFGYDAIHMANIASFERQTFFTLTEGAGSSLWQATIEQDEPPYGRHPMWDLCTVLRSIDHGERIIDDPQRTGLLSIYVDRYSPYRNPYEQSVLALFNVFSNIRILRMAGTIGFSHPGDDMAGDAMDATTLPSMLRHLSEPAQLLLPRLEQLWLSPIHLSDRPRSLPLLHDLLRNRVARPGSVLNTVHVDIPRPVGVEDSQAVAIENLVSHFTWMATD